MTSPLRRKHRTTVLKSRRKTGTDSRRSGLWQSLLGNLSLSCRIGMLAGVAAASSWQISWADDFRHAGRLGRVEPARIQFSDAKPLNPVAAEDDLGAPPADANVEVEPAQPIENQPSEKAVAADQSAAWRLRWRQPQASSVVSRPSVSTRQIAANAPSARKTPSATKAVLVWSESDASEPSPVRQVAQFTPADPLQDPFGDDPERNQVINAPYNISQPGQLQPGGGTGAKPSAPGGARTEGLDTSPIPGTQLQPNDSRLVPGTNRPIPRSNLPTPSKDSPFPTDDRPMPGDDRPLSPNIQPPATETPPTTPNVAPDLADPAPQPMETTEPPMPQIPRDPYGLNGAENEKPCNRTYNERNCCAADDRCNWARGRVRDYKISNIILDISPHFTNTDLKLTIDEQMARTLAEAPSRTWRDRQGKDLAHGRIQDFRNGRVHVETDSGGVIKIPFQHLSDDDLCFFTAWWSLPNECPLADDQYVPRNWLCSSLNWKASGLCHKPLYFEEVALERYGHSTGPFTQPFISTAHFFGSLVSLPYQMGMHPPQECQYVLGYYRPGNCAPWLVPPFPVSGRGALAEAAAIVGGIYLIP